MSTSPTMPFGSEDDAPNFPSSNPRIAIPQTLIPVAVILFTAAAAAFIVTFGVAIQSGKRLLRARAEAKRERASISRMYPREPSPPDTRYGWDN
jgi:hypothetical protein